ncbi:MAG: hypothetical protein ACO3JV_13140 [Pseudomonadales bacterium]
MHHGLMHGVLLIERVSQAQDNDGVTLTAAKADAEHQYPSSETPEALHH